MILRKFSPQWYRIAEEGADARRRQLGITECPYLQRAYRGAWAHGWQQESNALRELRRLRNAVSGPASPLREVDSGVASDHD